jgi:hypothetical protein
VADKSRQQYWDVPFNTNSGVPVNLLILGRFHAVIEMAGA